VHFTSLDGKVNFWCGSGTGRPATAVVCLSRHTLGSRRVTELVNHHMLFWACSVNKPEGYRGTFVCDSVVFN